MGLYIVSEVQVGVEGNSFITDVKVVLESFSVSRWVGSGCVHAVSVVQKDPNEKLICILFRFVHAVSVFW